MGGAQRYLMEVAPALSSKGYEVLIAMGGEGNDLMSNVKIQNPNQIQSSKSKSNPKSKYQKLKHLKRSPCPFQAILSIIEIYKLIKKERPDVLFLCSSMAGFLGSLAVFFYKMFQVPSFKFQVIYRIGGWSFRDPRPCWQKKLIIFLERLTARIKNKIIVNSKIDYQAGLKHKIGKPGQLTLIHNGINPAELVFLPKSLAVDKLWKSDFHSLSTSSKFNVPSFKIIGVIANFYKTKGLEHLIKAAHLLGFKFHASSFKLVIIGDGQERKNIEALIKKYKLEDKVHLLGRIPDARKYLKAFDVFVLPSLKEGFPWVILEAMAAEVPIIATNVGAVPEILSSTKLSTRTILVDAGNSEILAKKIQELLNNPELAEKLVASARECLKAFSKDKMIEQTIKTIES